MEWIASLVAWALGLFSPKQVDPLAGYVVQEQIAEQVQPSVEPTVVQALPTLEPTKRQIKISPTKIPIRVVPTVGEWGVARQIGEHTWTMNVGMDEKMGTAKEIFDALNEYRVRRGSQRLTWNENLANYAQSRADYIFSIGRTDELKGFIDYLNNQNGYDKLGFTWLGENISMGYRMEGVHLIEWIYAGDKPHDDNQVNNRWNYVGIGVKGTATAVIFGTGKK